MQKNLDTIESKKVKVGDNMVIEKSEETSKVVQEATGGENTVSQSDVDGDCTLDYLNSVYCIESKKYLTQSDVEQKLMESGNKLKVLKLGSLFDSRILVYIRKYCPNLEQLELELKRYTSSHLNQAFANIKNLKSIILRGLDDCFLNDCAESLPENIEEISMTAPLYDHDDPQSLSAFEKFNNLRIFKLINYNLFDKRAEQIINKKSSIVELSLRKCRLQAGLHFFFNLNNLQYLDLGFTCSEQSDGTRILRHLSTTTKNLRYLDMSKYNGVIAHGIKLLSNLKNFEVLIMSSIRNYIDDINLVFHNLTLKKFEGIDCRDLNDNGVELLMKNSHDLEYLNVRGTKVTVKGIQNAIDIFKSRTNKVKLTIIIDYKKNERFESVPGLEIIMERLEYE